MKTTSLTASLFLVLGICQISFAQNWTGDGDGLDWHNAANWDGSVIPDTTDDFPSISGSAGNPFDVQIDQALSIGQINTSETTLTINADTAASAGTQAVFADANSIINVNANVQGIELGGPDSVLNLNSGTLTGNFGISGNNAQFNRSGGTLQLDSLNLSTAGIDVGLNSGDSVSGGVDLSGGSTVTLDGGTIGGALTLNDATFNWDGGTLGNSIDLSGSSTFNNNASENLTLSSLNLADSSNFELRSGDSSNSTFASGTGTLTVNGGTLTGFSEFDDGYTVDLNSGSISGDTFLFGGNFNWNGGDISGSLTLGEGSNGPAQFNRNSADSLNLTGLDLSGGTTLATESGDSVSGFTSVNDSQLTVNGATLQSVDVSNGGTVDFNDGQVSGSLTLSDSTFNWDGGTLGSSIDLSGSSTFNNNASENLTLSSLSLADSSNFELRSGDSSNSTFASGTGTLTVNGGTLTGFSEFDDGYTVDLNSGSISGDIILLGGILNSNGGDISGSLTLGAGNNGPAQLNRTSDDSLALTNLDLSGGTELALFNRDSIPVSGFGASVTDNAQLTIGGNTGIRFEDGLFINNGTLALDFGSLVSGSLDIVGQNSTINRDSTSSFGLERLSVSDSSFDFTGLDDVDDLSIDSNSTVNFRFDNGSIPLADATNFSNTINTLFIDADSELNIFQLDGQIEGLLLDDPFFDPSSIEGTINLFFDSAQGPANELDYAFAVSGNQLDDLQALIDLGQITFTGGSQPVEVFFDPTTDRTSIGFFSVAVPEPNSLALLAAAAASMLVRRRR